jgi:large subunit ribosomal protein L6
MSRIGNKPIKIPEGVEVKLTDGEVLVKGTKGELAQVYPKRSIGVEVKDSKLLVLAKDKSRQTRANHGLIRSLIANMVTGVTEGYEKKLNLVGTGYRVKKEGSKLVLSLGFSHPVEVDAPEGIEFEVEDNDKIVVSGADKQKVGQIAANIRAKREPEPYKGKGIKYEEEVVRRKPGKAAKAAA